MSDEARINYKTPDAHELDRALLQHRLWLEQPKQRDARQFNMPGHDFSSPGCFGDYSIERAVFADCRFAGRTSWPISLKGCAFLGCDLEEATFEGVDLSEVGFAAFHEQGKIVRRTKLTKTAFLKVVLDATRFEDCHGEHTQFENADFLSSAYFARVELLSANFKGAQLGGKDSEIAFCKFKKTDFSGAFFDAARIHTEMLFSDCKFVGAQFPRTKLTGVTLTDCDLTGAEWKDATLKNMTIDGSVFRKGKHLYGRHGPHMNNVDGALLARYSRRVDVCSWEWVRWFGSIRLFSVSYLAIIAIWLYAGGVKWYNHQLESLQLKHEVVAEFPIVKDLKMLPVPSDLGLMLLAVMVLAVAATAYLFCPTIVKENSETFWHKNLGREIFEYRIHAFRFWPLRWISGICYVVGGLWVLIHLGIKVHHTLDFLGVYDMLESLFWKVYHMLD